jgi:hypothetical protein
MKPETVNKWQARVDAWAASGLSGTEYAARAGVNASTLSWWKSWLRRTTAEDVSTSFVEVARPAALEAGVIELCIGGVDVRVRGRVESDALVQVLAALEGRR